MTAYVRVHNRYEPDGRYDHICTPGRADQITECSPDVWVVTPFEIRTYEMPDPPPGFRRRIGFHQEDPVDSWDRYQVLTELRDRENQYRQMMTQDSARNGV
jgi:hypothetical protein